MKRAQISLSTWLLLATLVISLVAFWKIDSLVHQQRDLLTALRKQTRTLVVADKSQLTAVRRLPEDPYIVTWDVYIPPAGDHHLELFNQRVAQLAPGQHCVEVHSRDSFELFLDGVSMIAREPPADHFGGSPFSNTTFRNSGGVEHLNCVTAGSFLALCTDEFQTGAPAWLSIAGKLRE